MTKTQEIMGIYGEVIEHEALQKGRQEGRQEGVVRTIEGMLSQDVPWSTIAAGTGVDEAEFTRLKQQLDTADGGADRPN